MSDALEVLEPAGSSVVFRGEAVEVKPLTVGKVPAIVRLARPALGALMTVQSLQGDINGQQFVDVLVGLVAEHGDAITHAVALAVDLPPDKVANADIDEFVVLATKVFEVNRDFFARRLAPLLRARAAAPAAGDGRTPSSS